MHLRTEAVHVVVRMDSCRHWLHLCTVIASNVIWCDTESVLCQATMLPYAKYDDVHIKNRGICIHNLCPASVCVCVWVRVLQFTPSHNILSRPHADACPSAKLPFYCSSHVHLTQPTLKMPTRNVAKWDRRQKARKTEIAGNSLKFLVAFMKNAPANLCMTRMTDPPLSDLMVLMLTMRLAMVWWPHAKYAEPKTLLFALIHLWRSKLKLLPILCTLKFNSIFSLSILVILFLWLFRRKVCIQNRSAEKKKKQRENFFVFGACNGSQSVSCILPCIRKFWTSNQSFVWHARHRNVK